MPFFKDLRRRSKANVRNDASSSSNESGGDANGTAQATKSSSTLGSYGNVSTAPSSLPRSLSNLATSNLNGPNGTRTTDATASPTTPLTRPSPISMQNKRYSMTVWWFLLNGCMAILLIIPHLRALSPVRHRFQNFHTRSMLHEYFPFQKIHG